MEKSRRQLFVLLATDRETLDVGLLGSAGNSPGTISSLLCRYMTAICHPKPCISNGKPEISLQTP